MTPLLIFTWHSAILCGLCSDSFMETTALWINGNSKEPFLNTGGKHQLGKKWIFMLLYLAGENKDKKTPSKFQLFQYMCYICFVETLNASIHLSNSKTFRFEMHRPNPKAPNWQGNLYNSNSPPEKGIQHLKCFAPQKIKGAISHSKCNVSAQEL